jgi:hypothetical protein
LAIFVYIVELECDPVEVLDPLFFLLELLKQVCGCLLFDVSLFFIFFLLLLWPKEHELGNECLDVDVHKGHIVRQVTVKHL